MLFKNYEKIIQNGEDRDLKTIRKEILDILSHALDAVNPYKSVKKHFRKNKIIVDNKNFNLSIFNDIYLVGFGKASVGMANAVCDSIQIKEGVVVTNEKENKVKNDNIRTLIGIHPIPDEKSLKASDEIIRLIKKCKKNDLLLVLISGGGSALLCKPKVNLEDMQKITSLLLKCGANINEINTIRKHISQVKGGQLLKNVNCKVISLVISDIIGDPLSFIASGPTYPDSSTYKDAQDILEKYNLWGRTPNSIKSIIGKGVIGKIQDTPDRNNPIFKNVDNFIVANNDLACNSSLEKAEELGYNTLLLTNKLEGEARDIGSYLVEKAINFKTTAEKILFVSGGETTVTLKGNGKGGRNQEMVLSSVEKISNENIVFCSFATDGVDGNSNAAGAIADKNSLKRVKSIGLNPRLYLDNNDSNSFFRELADLFITGPTGTNVMDIQIIVKYKE